MANINIMLHKYIRTCILAVLFVGLASCDDKDENPTLPDVDQPEEVVLPEDIKVISFNILEGMKTDRPNDYDNFVAWVQEHDPDILALQEVNGFRQKDLEELAARWGHKYVITNLKATDNYPVAITSKYPIESRRRLTMHMSHGAIFARLLGTDLNIVVTHYWPQSYWHQQGDGLGNDYRLQETNVLMDSTIRKFPNEPDWILLGDFNSRSRLDYLPVNATHNYAVTDQIAADGYRDAIHFMHGTIADGVTYDFRYPGARIDFIFATQPVLQRMKKAYPLYGEFVEKYSDHPAMYMEFSLK